MAKRLADEKIEEAANEKAAEEAAAEKAKEAAAKAKAKKEEAASAAAAAADGATSSGGAAARAAATTPSPRRPRRPSPRPRRPRRGGGERRRRRQAKVEPKPDPEAASDAKPAAADAEAAAPSAAKSEGDAPAEKAEKPTPPSRWRRTSPRAKTARPRPRLPPPRPRRPRPPPRASSRRTPRRTRRQSRPRSPTAPPTAPTPPSPLGATRWTRARCATKPKAEGGDTAKGDAAKGDAAADGATKPEPGQQQRRRGHGRGRAACARADAGGGAAAQDPPRRDRLQRRHDRVRVLRHAPAVPQPVPGQPLPVRPAAPCERTSMMGLYHVHNPGVPKFLMSCRVRIDINSGYAYTAQHDSEYHLCEVRERARGARGGRARARGRPPSHRAPRAFCLTQNCFRSNPDAQRMPFRRTAVGSEAASHQLTEEQRRERQRSIQLHMQLLQHASACRNPSCPSANCSKMKNLLKHGATCQVRVQGGCAICRRIWALLQIHARQCRRDNCVVPKCRQLGAAAGARAAAGADGRPAARGDERRAPRRGRARRPRTSAAARGVRGRARRHDGAAMHARHGRFSESNARARAAQPHNRHRRHTHIGPASGAARPSNRGVWDDFGNVHFRSELWRRVGRAASVRQCLASFPPSSRRTPPIVASSDERVSSLRPKRSDKYEGEF